MKRVKIVLVLAAAAVMTGKPAFAQGQPPNVLAARFNAEHTVLTIEGSSFECRVPRVWLAEVELRVASCTNVSIQALVAEQPAPATYRVTISTGPGEGHLDSIAVTVVDDTEGRIGPEERP